MNRPARLALALALCVTTASCRPNKPATMPVFVSPTPLFALISLDKHGDRTLALAFDESRGEGTGYDRMYADRNLNENLRDDVPVDSAAQRDGAVDFGTVHLPVSYLGAQGTPPDYCDLRITASESGILPAARRTTFTMTYEAMTMSGGVRWLYRSGGEIETTTSRNGVLAAPAPITPGIVIRTAPDPSSADRLLVSALSDSTTIERDGKRVAPVVTVTDSAGRITFRRPMKLNRRGRVEPQPVPIPGRAYTITVSLDAGPLGILRDERSFVAARARPASSLMGSRPLYACLRVGSKQTLLALPSRGLESLCVDTNGDGRFSRGEILRATSVVKTPGLVMGPGRPRGAGRLSSSFPAFKRVTGSGRSGLVYEITLFAGSADRDDALTTLDAHCKAQAKLLGSKDEEVVYRCSAAPEFSSNPDAIPVTPMGMGRGLDVRCSQSKDQPGKILVTALPAGYGSIPLQYGDAVPSAKVTVRDHNGGVLTNESADMASLAPHPENPRLDTIPQSIPYLIELAPGRYTVSVDTDMWSLGSMKGSATITVR